MPMGGKNVLPQGPKLSRQITYAGFGFLVWYALVNYWIGGVVLDRKFVNAQHSVQLRDPDPHWVDVSATKYWIQYVTEVGHVIVVCAGLLIWLIHFSLKVSKE